jgi:hypothetical protein
MILAKLPPEAACRVNAPTRSPGIRMYRPLFTLIVFKKASGDGLRVIGIKSHYQTASFLIGLFQALPAQLVKELVRIVGVAWTSRRRARAASTSNERNNVVGVHRCGPDRRDAMRLSGLH